MLELGGLEPESGSRTDRFSEENRTGSNECGHSGGRACRFPLDRKPPLILASCDPGRPGRCSPAPRREGARGAINRRGSLSQTL